MVSIWNRLQQRNIREEILLHQWKMPGKIIYYQVSSVCFPHAYFQEFGQDNTPLSESEFTLPLLSRIRRSLHNNSTKVTAVLQQQDLDEIVSKLNATILGTYSNLSLRNTSCRHNFLFSGNDQTMSSSQFDIDLDNPIHVHLDATHDSRAFNYYSPMQNIIFSNL